MIPESGDQNAEFTAKTYDVNDPRKMRLRKLRREMLSECLDLLQEGPPEIVGHGAPIMTAIVPLPTPDNADWGYGWARLEGDRLTAQGGGGQVVTFYDTGELLEIREVCDASACEQMGARALTDTGVVFGNRDANQQRGELVFIRCHGQAIEEHRLAGAAAATAFWLGESVKASGNTVVARCRANKWCPGSEDWLVVLGHQPDGWKVEAELRFDWLSDYAVKGDALAVVDGGGIHCFERADRRWSREAYLAVPDGQGPVALDGQRLAVEDLGLVTIYERQGASWGPVAELRVSQEGRYPSIDLALSGDRLAVGTSQRLGKADGGVLIYRRHEDGRWREEQRVLNKDYGGVLLAGDRLAYRRNDRSFELFRLDRLLAEHCAAVAPKGVERDIAALDILWVSPVKSKKRHFLVALPEGRLGLCTQVRRRWKWLEGEWAQLRESVPEVWRELMAAAAAHVG